MGTEPTWKGADGCEKAVGGGVELEELRSEGIKGQGSANCDSFGYTMMTFSVWSWKAD